jgi:hypothetical protein
MDNVIANTYSDAMLAAGLTDTWDTAQQLAHIWHGLLLLRHAGYVIDIFDLPVGLPVAHVPFVQNWFAN